jgi:hypothetical protein
MISIDPNNEDDLINLQTYLSKYRQNEQPAAFELLISKIFSSILKLPFFDSNNDDSTKKFKVLWGGTEKPIRCAPSGSCDCYIYARGFNCILESSLRDGPSQWKNEGQSTIRHLEEVITKNGWDPKRSYGILVVKNIHSDTFNNFEKYCNRYKIIILDIDNLLIILNTSNFAFTMKNLDVAHLFSKGLDVLDECENAQSYVTDLKMNFSQWRKKVLRDELNIFMAINSFNKMKNEIQPKIYVSQLYEKLNKETSIIKYLKLADVELSYQLIINSIKQNGFGIHKRGFFDDDEIYHLTFEDCETRFNTIINKIK